MNVQGIMSALGIGGQAAQSNNNWGTQGQAVPREDWGTNLQKMLGVIAVRRAANPVYAPFAPGTKTLAGKQFDLSASRAGGGGPTKGEIIGAVYRGAVDQMDSLMSQRTVADPRDIQDDGQGTKIVPGLSKEDAFTQVQKQIRALAGQGGLGLSDTEDIIKTIGDTYGFSSKSYYDQARDAYFKQSLEKGDFSYFDKNGNAFTNP